LVSQGDVSAQLIVRQLLSTLENSPLREEARALGESLTRKGWQALTHDDVSSVMALVARLNTPPAPSSNQALVVATPLPLAQSEPWTAATHFSAWVDTIHRGRVWLALLEELTRADDVDTVHALLTRLFVDELRYAPHDIDESERIGPTQTLKRLRTVARHGTFVVSLLELSFPYRYTSVFQPVFRVHPYGLVIAIAPGWNKCQFVYRAIEAEGVSPYRSRPLVGALGGDDVHDNPVLWLRRLELLRPRGGETDAELLRRHGETLGASPIQLAAEWPAQPVSPHEPLPGDAWGEHFRREREAFLQEQVSDSEPRAFWGLERVLRNGFPIGLDSRRGRIRFLRYKLADADASPDRALATGQSWVRPLTLELEIICADDGTRLPVSLRAAVLEVTEDGRMVIDGTWYRLVPRVQENGRLLNPRLPASRQWAGGTEEEEEELLEDDSLEDLLQVDIKDEEEASQTLLPETPPHEVPAGRPGTRPFMSFAGASLCTLLEIAGHRKVAVLGKYLRRYEDDPRKLPRELVSRLRSLAPRAEPLLLLGKHFLKTVLDPVDTDSTCPTERLPVLCHTDPRAANHPPAWACPEAAVDLPMGTWLPVACARLNPAGDLVLPLADAQGTPRLLPPRNGLLETNLRLGAPAVGPTSWWIASALRPFASLRAGSLEGAAHLATRGVELRPMRSLRVSSQRSAAWLSPHLLASNAGLRQSLQRKRRLHVDIPAPPWHSGPGLHWLRRVRGERVEPGDVWLEAPLSLWSVGHNHSESTEWLRTSQKSPLWNLLKDAHSSGEKETREKETRRQRREREEEEFSVPQRWRIPPGVRGTVLELRQEEIVDRAGLRTGWRLTLVVGLEPPEVPWGHLVLPNGRAIPVLGWLAAGDAPYDEDGEPVELLVEEPSLTEPAPPTWIWFDGGTGEPLEAVGRIEGTLHYVPLEGPLATGPDLHLRFRMRDGEGIPAHPHAPGLSARDRIWWLARDATGALRVARTERHWSGEQPPFFHHLLDVLEAAHLTHPLSAPPDVEVMHGDGPAAHFLGLPATRLQNHETWFHDTEATQRWACACGRVTGPHRAFEICESAPDVADKGCGTAVRLRPARGNRPPLPVQQLAEPVLHPWYEQPAAAALGMTADELRKLAIKHGGKAVCGMLQRAMKEPEPSSAVRKKLEFATGERREELIAGLHALKQELVRGREDLPSRWILQRLNVLPATLHPTGLPPGVPGIVQTPLRRAYVQLQNAHSRLERFLGGPSRLLTRLARRSLYEAVHALFGPSNSIPESGEPRNLAGLLARLWPLTRAPKLRSVVPGTFSLAVLPAGLAEEPGPIVGLTVIPWQIREAIPRAVDDVSEDAEDVEEADQEAEEEEAKAVDGTKDITPPGFGRRELALQVPPRPGLESTGLLDADGCLFLPHRPRVEPRLTSANYWADRAATARLVGEHLPHLVMLMGSFVARPGETDEGHGVTGSTLRPGPSLQALRQEGLDVPEETLFIGLFTLAELLEALSHPEAHPAPLCRILESPLPRNLASDVGSALASVTGLVDAAFPGGGVLRKVGRALLVRALCGWWKGPATEPSPSGWEWHPPHQHGAPDARRMLPPFASSAWNGWPAMRAALSPVSFFLEHAGQPVESWPPIVQAAVGFELAPLHVPTIQAEEPATPPAAPAPEKVPALLPPQEAPAPVRPEEMRGSEDTDPVGPVLLTTSILDWLRSPPQASTQSGAPLLSTSLWTWMKRG
jgi:hypothetical protein